ncbi:Exonuclease SbcC [Euzebya pacifica]|uniref:Nuclease SbcCD subunit C n=1 Tax=Euzebya pacifica TaxID=1608957 RepID=A0A346XRZ1_9ACTN|nr:SMC family ATPase [Euzebya pacifica]AXV04988.1 Exonuclease SbcC [Euzebya pacifica]
MRPLTLTVEGLRSFRASETIDFTGRDYLAIIGDTGAGKSSLLEAMGWALYGNTSWSGQPNQELMHDTSTATRVVLTFSVRGQTWRATRTLRRRDDRTVGAAQAELVRLEEKGDGALKEVDGVDKVRAVNDRVQELIGLNYEAFKRTVVLPQGQFAQLLVADDPRVRASILEQVWGVEGLADIKAAADETLRDIVPTASRVEQALADAPQDPAAHLTALREDVERLTSVAGSAASTTARAKDAVAAVEEASAKNTAAENARRLLLVDNSLATSANGLSAVAKELAEAEAAQATVTASAREELAAVPADDDGMSVAEVTTAQGVLARLPRLAADVDEAGSALVEARAEIDRLGNEAADADERVAAAKEQQEQHEAGRAALTTAVEEAQASVHAAEQRLGAWRSALAEQESAEASAARLQDGLAGLRSAVDAADAAAKAAHEEATRAQSAKESADREHAAIAAAAGLSVGDDCTVCHRPLPDGWSAPGDSAHDAIAAAARKAVSAEREADAALTKATATLESGEAQLESATKAVEQRTAAVGTAESALVAVLGPVDVTRSDEELLTGLREKAEVARAALTSHDAAGRELAEATQAARTAATIATANNQAAVAAEARAAAALTRARKECEEAVGLIPPALEILVQHGSPGATTQMAGLDEAAAQLTERESVLAERSAARLRLQAKLAELEKERTALDQRRCRELTEPLEGLVRKLDGERQQLERLQASLGVDGVEVPSLVGVTADSAPAVVAAFHSGTARLAEVAVTRLNESTEALIVARAVLDEVGQAIGTSGDVELVAELERRQKDAEVKAGIAQHEAEAFEARVEPIRQLREASAGLEEQRLVLEDLSAALNPGAFPKWLTMRRSHDLLLHASVLLEEMTAGRYSFAEVVSPDDPWKVIDNDSGLPRSPASLSGGETFVASLSLALGMVEMMARSGGHLESLWLDEGFGALDRGNLDSAVEALSQVAARGRMVAVISHVRAVAEQVNHVLAVTHGSRGSQARWLAPNERAALAEMDATGEPGAMAAVAGLLD